jgi:hypothetical protein
MLPIPAAACDPEHSPIIIWGLAIIIAVMGKALYDYASGWKRRIELKLDQAIETHIECRTSLTKEFMPRAEFAEFLSLRNAEWKEFKEMFREFTDKFWKHTHEHNGKPEVP